MPTANPGVVALFPIQEAIFNKDDGTPLSAGVVHFFYDDPAQRTVYKTIYQQVQLSANTYDYVALNNPITLTSIGTFADANGDDIIPFLWPYEGTPDSSTGAVEKYYIEVYASAAPVGDGALQFTRSNWPPNVQDNPSPTDIFEATSNEISNTQFARISFSPAAGVTFSVTGTDTVNPIAPNWDLVTSGTGTVTVIQVDVVDSNAPSNPAFALDVAVAGAGLTSAKLRQRLYNSPRLLAQSYVSTNIVANSKTGAPATIVIHYVSSNGTTIELLNKATTPTGFSTLQNSEAVFINTANANPGSTGYVDFDIVLPLSSHVQLTAVQMAGVQNVNSLVPYLQQTTEQEILQYQLAYKQIPSAVVGWDFPLNPAQFGIVGQAAGTIPASAIGANRSKYVWDQTIIFQSANSGVGVTRGSSNELLLTAAATTQMAIIQYLGPTEARKILNAPICVNVSARASVATKATVSLWYKTSATLPDITTNLSIVASLDANGKPATFNGTTWTEVPRLAGNALITIGGTTSNTSFHDYPLSGWDMNGIAACNTATYFAIVIGTASVTTPGTIGFNSVSLQPGSIPTRPAPQTADQVLRECQYYYEKSYSPATASGTANTTDALTFSQVMPVGVTTANVGGFSTLIGYYCYDAKPALMYQTAFGFNFKQAKRAAPNITLFSTKTVTTPNNLTAYIGIVPISTGTGVQTNGDVTWATYWVTSALSTDGVSFSPVTNQLANTPFSFTSGAAPDYYLDAACWVSFHYTLDSRLGVV